MKLTPLDIKKQDFKHGFRGYEEEEVRAFLQMLSEQWQELLDEKRRLEDRVREQRSKMEHYEKIEEALQEALETARENSKKTLANAEREAQLILQEARVRATEVERDAVTRRDRARHHLETLLSQRDQVVAQQRAFLTTQLDVLSDFEQRAQRPVSPAGMEEAGRSAAAAPAPDAAVRAKDAREEAGETGPAPAMEGEAGEVEAVPVSDAPPPDVEPEEAGPQHVRSGPGWIVRPVITASGIQESPSRTADSVPEQDLPQQHTTASPEEIEKIRRILNDLD